MSKSNDLRFEASGAPKGLAAFPQRSFRKMALRCFGALRLRVSRPSALPHPPRALFPLPSFPSRSGGPGAERTAEAASFRPREPVLRTLGSDRGCPQTTSALVRAVRSHARQLLSHFFGESAGKKPGEHFHYYPFVSPPTSTLGSDNPELTPTPAGR